MSEAPVNVKDMICELIVERNLSEDMTEILLDYMARTEVSKEVLKLRKILESGHYPDSVREIAMTALMQKRAL